MIADAERQQPPLECAEQFGVEAQAAPFGSHRPAKDPGAGAVDACGNRPGDLVTDESHERRLARCDRRQRVGERERSWRPGRIVLPQPDRLLEPRIVEIADDVFGRFEGGRPGRGLYRRFVPFAARAVRPWNHSLHAWKPPTS
jgi:hypothetical protein